jgi:hypothetical protein
VLEFDVEEGIVVVVVSGSMASVWEGGSSDSGIVQQREGKKQGGGGGHIIRGNGILPSHLSKSGRSSVKSGIWPAQICHPFLPTFRSPLLCRAAVKRLPSGTPASAPLSPFLNDLSETRPAPKTYSGFTIHSAPPQKITANMSQQFHNISCRYKQTCQHLSLYKAYSSQIQPNFHIHLPPMSNSRLPASPIKNFRPINISSFLISTIFHNPLFALHSSPPAPLKSDISLAPI